MESAGAFIGLYGGMAAGLMAWWIGLYFAKKKGEWMKFFTSSNRNHGQSHGSLR